MRKDIEMKNEIFRRKTIKNLLLELENYKKNNTFENLEELINIIKKSIKVLKYTPIIEQCLNILGEYTIKKGYMEEIDDLKDILWDKITKKINKKKL